MHNALYIFQWTMYNIAIYRNIWISQYHIVSWLKYRDAYRIVRSLAIPTLLSCMNDLSPWAMSHANPCLNNNALLLRLNLVHVKSFQFLCLYVQNPYIYMHKIQIRINFWAQVTEQQHWLLFSLFDANSIKKPLSLLKIPKLCWS